MKLKTLDAWYALDRISDGEYERYRNLILSEGEQKATDKFLQSRMLKTTFPSYAEPFYPKISDMLIRMKFNNEVCLKRHLAAVVLALVQSPFKQDLAFEETHDLHGRKAIWVTYKNADGDYEQIFVDRDIQPRILYEKVCINIGLVSNYDPESIAETKLGL